MTDKNTQRTPDGTTGRHHAAAFDIRTFIAALIGLYGVVLVLTGIFGTSDGDLAKAGGANINLLAGLGMLGFAAAFVIWVQLRPVSVPDEVPGEEKQTLDEATRH